ncbi:MAG: DUF1566 domain-containing protein [Rhodoferax sp.]|nr:DUF1566 domain-containing protein [Rhodoferax sp.]
MAACVIGIAFTACGGGGGGGGGAEPAPVVVKPSITTQPVGKTVVVGQTATFTVTATGTDPLSYQWKKGGANIPDATSSSYTTPATSITDNNALFSVVVTNSADSVTSENAKLTVNLVVPTITAQPAAQTITAGEMATFSVTATSSEPLTYLWKKNGSDISGATTSSYTTPAMSIAGSGVVYSVVVRSSGGGTVTSKDATLTVNKSSATGFSPVAKASGGTYDTTECVKENSTGFVWEGKTASGDRAGSNTYTNYDSTASKQFENGLLNPTRSEIDARSNTIGYVNAVKTIALCGFTDWRMPTKDELSGIVVNDQNPKIDSASFPNTQATYYWSSSPWDGVPKFAWVVDFKNGGPSASGSRDEKYHVRLVR